ncbi:conserved hypothetical protein [Tenacibaculum sediminilitoris]|uniref:toxin-antitoxin system YwqK family antitoxin n=1 Tax=Tenacibaculum sediminilitoris TaxID=1820334 RepID=UPI00389581D0
MKNNVFILCLFITFSLVGQRVYHKSFYENGTLKEEGWLEKNKKIDYWIFYYKNGNKKKEGRFKKNIPVKYWYFYRENSSKEKEGHFVNGIRNKWWVLYSNKGNVYQKCQIKNNKKNGYCLLYEKHKLTKAIKFIKGIKLKEWNNLSSFAKENSLNDLK